MYCANFILTYNDCKVIVEPPLLKYPINMTCQYRGQKLALRFDMAYTTCHL